MAYAAIPDRALPGVLGAARTVVTEATAGTTHHVALDGQGYMVEPTTYSRSLANPLAAKLGSGEANYSDLSEWSAWIQSDWRAGMLEEEHEAPDRYRWGYGIESRVKRQLTLGPEIKGPYSTTAAPVKFAAFNGNWYVAAGTALRKWNEGTAAWDAVKTDFAATVTDLAVYDGYLFCCLGEANNAMTMSTAEGFADAGVPIRLATVYEGYLYRVDNGNEVYYTNAYNGSWCDAIYVGRDDYTINAIGGWDGDVWAAKDDGLWYVRGDLAYQVMNWLSALDSANGGAIVEYNGELFMPLGPGLIRYTGQLADMVGPNREAGLPENYAGKIVDLIALQSGLYAAVDAGSTAGHKSSVLSWKGGGWHPIVLATATTERILTIAYETLHTPGRLWFGQSTKAGYVSIADQTDNPTEQPSWTYTAAGEYETPWFSGGMLEVEKDFESVLVVAESLSATQTVVVTYEVDRSGTYYTLGTANESPQEELEFATSSFTNKTTASGCTSTSIVCSADPSGDLAAGEWVRINNEVRQVATVTSATKTFTLYRALSAAPAAGVSVYAARAAGREIRLKYTFATASSSASPVVSAIRLKYMAMVRDRWAWSFAIKVGDNLQTLHVDGAASIEARTAAQLTDDLDALCNRTNPITFVDINGDSYTVKVVGGQEVLREYHSGSEIETAWQLSLLEV